MGAPDIFAPLIVAPESVIIIDHSDVYGLKKAKWPYLMLDLLTRLFFLFRFFPLAIMEFYFIFTIELRISPTLL